MLLRYDNTLQNRTKNKTIGYLLSQARQNPSCHLFATRLQLTSLRHGKTTPHLHFEPLSQECECERAEHDGFQRHAVSQYRDTLEHIKLGDCGMVCVLNAATSPITIPLAMLETSCWILRCFYLLRQSEDVRARSTRTQHDLEACSFGHTKRRVLVVVGEGVGIRTHRLGGFGVVVRRALARSVVLARAAVRGLVVLGASREARVERRALHVAVWVRVDAVAGALRWRDLQVPGTPLGDLGVGGGVEGEGVGGVCSQEGLRVGVEVVARRTDVTGASYAGRVGLVGRDVVNIDFTICEEDDGHGQVVAVD